ncbi:hypothetical protein DB31_5910 [Hyalangium minutum]|uniref:Uncharacterized protein n=1 Tax=Hyalangium minutum TaxID=394096 RepID=A0A085VYQ8_9BACT|nr:hypothetical protein DB31_5910 [Hyalangium minutum]
MELCRHPYNLVSSLFLVLAPQRSRGPGSLWPSFSPLLC